MASSDTNQPPQSHHNETEYQQSLSQIFELPINSTAEKTFFKQLKESTEIGEGNHLRNLSNVTNIPFRFERLLSLGLNFCIPQEITKNQIDDCLKEACRKIGWKLFFNKESKTKFADLGALQKWHITFRAKFRQYNPTASTSECPDYDNFFKYDELLSELYKKLTLQNTPNPPEALLLTLGEQFKRFCVNANIMVVEADKNNGICLVNTKDYDNEALQILTSGVTYIPTTKSHFNIAMIEFKDLLKKFQTSLFANNELSSIINDKTNNIPGRFKLYPKMQKYDSNTKNFPPGQPISFADDKTTNIADSLLHHVLKPCHIDVKDLLIDTQHLLILLDNLNLDPSKKYCIVKINADSLYSSLKYNDCKKHCIKMFQDCQSSDKEDLNAKDLQRLFDLSFKYNFITFKNEWYKQVRGIEMGNSFRDIVVNITLFKEFDHLFKHEFIAFYKRLLDNFILILECREGVDIEEWLASNIYHDYLKLDMKIEFEVMNFLDVTIKLNQPGNRVSVELSSNHKSLKMPLHGSSNHPPEFIQSLFHSEGVRVIQTCSDMSARVENLYKLKRQFQLRGHNEAHLEEVINKLLTIDRKTALIPNNPLLINYLNANEESIYKALKLNETSKENDPQPDYVHIVFPFYKQIANYSKTIQDCIVDHIQKNCEQSGIDDVTISVFFSQLKNIKDLLNATDQ